MGDNIFAFPDLSNALVKKRATFNSVETKPHQKAIKFCLCYPSVLFHPPTMEYKFNNVEDVERFFNQHLTSDFYLTMAVKSLGGHKP